MLELSYSQLELFPFVARDESELPQGGVQSGACPLADPDRIAAPPRGRLVDPHANLFLAQPAALGQRVRKLVRALGRQRDRADEREYEAPNGLVHADGYGDAGGDARA